MQMFAQCVKNRYAIIEVEAVNLAVDRKTDGTRVACGPSRRFVRSRCWRFRDNGRECDSARYHFSPGDARHTFPALQSQMIFG